MWGHLEQFVCCLEVVLHITEEPHANATIVRKQSPGGMTQENVKHRNKLQHSEETKRFSMILKKC